MGLECCQMVNQYGDFLFQLRGVFAFQSIISIHTKDERVHGDMEKLGKLYEQIY